MAAWLYRPAIFLLEDRVGLWDNLVSKRLKEIHGTAFRYVYPRNQCLQRMQQPALWITHSTELTPSKMTQFMAR